MSNVIIVMIFISGPLQIISCPISIYQGQIFFLIGSIIGNHSFILRYLTNTIKINMGLDLFPKFNKSRRDLFYGALLKA